MRQTNGDALNLQMRLGPRTQLALLTALLATGYLAQASVYLNHDVAWVLYSSNLMLNGAVFGKDVIAANPPLIWWISMIPNLLSDWLGLLVIPCFRLLVTAGIGASLVVSRSLLARQGVSATTQTLFLLLGIYLLAFAVDRDFGQREHLAMLLLLPYFLAVAHRMEGRTFAPVTAVILGAAAGVGVALKPYFVLVPLLLEAALWWRTRRLSHILRPEALGAVFAIVLYGCALLLFAEPWLFDVAPNISRVYWAFSRPLGDFAMVTAQTFLLPAVAAFVVLRVNPSPRSVVLVLAGIGFFGAAVWQAKYYSYHLYPAHALLLLAVAVGIPGMRKPWQLLAAGVMAIVLIQDVKESVERLAFRSDAGRYGKHVHAVVTFVEENVPQNGSFLAMSTHPYPGFPTALYASRTWASASNSAIYLPAVVRLREAGQDADPTALAFAETSAREAVMLDLARAPDVVLIDQQTFRHAINDSKFDYLSFYLEQPAFQEVWSDYEPMPSAPAGFAAYRRKQEQ